MSETTSKPETKCGFSCDTEDLDSIGRGVDALKSGQVKIRLADGTLLSIDKLSLGTQEIALEAFRLGAIHVAMIFGTIIEGGDIVHLLLQSEALKDEFFSMYSQLMFELAALHSAAKASAR